MAAPWYVSLSTSSNSLADIVTNEIHIVCVWWFLMPQILGNRVEKLRNRLGSSPSRSRRVAIYTLIFTF